MYLFPLIYLQLFTLLLKSCVLSHLSFKPPSKAYKHKWLILSQRIRLQLTWNQIIKRAAIVIFIELQAVATKLSGVPDKDMLGPRLLDEVTLENLPRHIHVTRSVCTCSCSLSGDEEGWALLSIISVVITQNAVLGQSDQPSPWYRLRHRSSFHHLLQRKDNFNWI